MIGDSPMTLASQTLGIPLTHVVHMGMDPAAAPKSPFPSRAPTHFGLCYGIVRLGFSDWEDSPPQTLPKTPYQPEK